ncbi:recombinase family protein [Bacillus sp. V3B]|nr:recombinase family protein [Bacillus sp. V3B]
MGISKENKVGKTIIYARVSNQGQKDDLVNQVEFLKQFANARGIIVDEVLTDIGSGLNYKRKKGK